MLSIQLKRVKKETKREREGKTDRKTERQKDRKTERQKDRKTERQKDRKIERQRDREKYVCFGLWQTKVFKSKVLFGLKMNKA